MFLKPKAVQFKRKGKPFTIELASVTDFQRVSREIAGSERPVLAVRHQSGGQAITSLAATSSARKMNILGRYLRLEYSDIMEEIGDISLSDDEKQMLVAIYSTSQGMPLADILNKEASEVTMMLSDLRDDGLVEDAPEGPTLTPKGKIVASNFLEDVNT
ncbi:CheF family chemotaxis protein [Haloarculaceae archaeon H-GB11]|nr:CheF family chemotaxis protein [Haloarculaceae archaeon H-GB11]